jgi:hypothetical protein
VRGILQSYRWRRRLAWTGGFVFLVVGFVIAAILLPKDHGRQVELTPTGTEPSEVEAPTRRVRLTAADRRAVNRTLVAFVRTAVTRDDPVAAWDLATPAMRSSVDHKHWNAGELPVQPYPAHIPDEPSWNVLSSYVGDLSIDLVLQPRRGSRRGPIAFAVELKQEKKGGRWLVDSMIPEQAFAPTAPPPKTKHPVPIANGRGPKGTLSPKWFIVPGVLLGLIALVPVLVLLNTWRRNRAIERRYRAERGL